MGASKLALIAAAEVATLLLVACIYLVLKNRNLRGLIKALQSRMEVLVKDLKKAKAEKNNSSQTVPEVRSDQDTSSPEQSDSGASYQEHVDKQIKLTRDHHDLLNSDQDIVLDLDPESPLPRRAAALRYALLIAEKEATASGEANTPNWQMINAKYERIFNFYSEYSDLDEEGQDNQSEIDSLAEELTNAKKRINNLEKFKSLYFELEEKWESSKDKAETHYAELSEMASKTEAAEDFTQLLDSYHASYDGVNNLIQEGVDAQAYSVSNIKFKDGDHAGEIRHLRSVAADQHVMINQLQQKLSESTSDSQREEIISGLQEELQKQMRFVQESETCIQLMEEELSNATRELDQLRSRSNLVPQLKGELKDVRDQRDEFELKIYALKTENRKLIKRIKTATETPRADTGESRELKKKLNDLEAQYASLEEKYLDLKLQN